MEFDVEKCFTLFLETLELIVHHFFLLEYRNLSSRKLIKKKFKHKEATSIPHPLQYIRSEIRKFPIF